MSKHRRRTPVACLDIITGLLSGIVFLTFGLLLALLIQPLYTVFLKFSTLPVSSGILPEILKSDYHSVISTLFPWKPALLQDFSVVLEHDSLTVLSDYRILTTILIAVFTVSLGGFLALYIARIGTHRKTALISGILAVFFPLALSVTLLIGYPSVLRSFHPLIFGHPFLSQDSYLLTLLPYSYIALLSIVIVLPGLAAGIILMLRYPAREHLHDDDYVMPKKRNYYYI